MREIDIYKKQSLLDELQMIFLVGTQTTRQILKTLNPLCTLEEHLLFLMEVGWYPHAHHQAPQHLMFLLAILRCVKKFFHLKNYL